MKHLITGATGNIGSLVTHRLIERGIRPCIFVRDEAKARELFGGAVDIRVGDLGASQRSLAAAFAGMDTLFLLNSGPDLAARDRVAARAARTAGVSHLVKLSTLDVLSGVGTGPWHAQGETAVQESGLDYTFIRSAGFMSNALYWAEAIKTERVLRSSTGDGKIAFIHPADIADVAVHALTTRDLRREAVVITGPKALSYAEMADVVGSASGKRIRYVPISDREARFGRDAYAEAVTDIWRAIREGRLTTTTDAVQRIIGRAPYSFEQWVTENLDEFIERGRTRGTRAQS
ncbi:NAD(P)H-binding protein [Pseudoduganella sp. S-14]|jgi:uncharacterized protein YbjT (DUF2867 family)|uniref:NAD(P)H-binding protein n=1 Tax=Pseudoduganella sp. S-14 TaxID=3404065 RepID=UPI003CF316AA